MWTQRQDKLETEGVVAVYSQEFAKLWFKLSKDMKLFMEGQLAPSLTEGQLYVLEYLLAREDVKMKPSDLVDYLSTTPAAITTLLDRMERANLIVRERDDKDRRIVWVVVTDTGKQECRRGVSLRQQFLDGYLNRISAHNQQVLVYLLGKVANL